EAQLRNDAGSRSFAIAKGGARTKSSTGISASKGTEKPRAIIKVNSMAARIKAFKRPKKSRYAKWKRMDNQFKEEDPINGKKYPSIVADSPAGRRIARYFAGMDPWENTAPRDSEIMHDHKPFARAPFPKVVPLNNSISGLEPNPIRVCFRVGELISIINNVNETEDFQESSERVVEFYGRVCHSRREGNCQYIQLGDL